MTEISSTILYAGVGLLIFILSLVFLELITKFSITKNIIKEGNIALAIVLGSIIASLGMIISAAIH